MAHLPNAVLTERRMDIHVRRMANVSDMNVQATGIAASDRVATTRPVSGSCHSGFGHNALNFRGRTPQLRFTIDWSEASGEAAMPR